MSGMRLIIRGKQHSSGEGPDGNRFIAHKYQASFQIRLLCRDTETEKR